MKPLYLSFSSDSTYQTCGWQYKLSRIDRISEIEESMTTMFGKVVHTTIYLHLRSEIDGAQFSAPDFFEMEFKSRAMESSLRLAANWSIEDFIACGRLMMERFAEYWGRGDYEVVRDASGEPILEREFRIKLPDNIIYTAIIDAVLRRKRDGWIIVTDWKTPAQASFKEFALLSEQLTGYEVAVGAFLESLGLERIDGTMFVELIKRKFPSKRGAMGPTVDEPTVVRLRTQEEKDRWLEARLENARNIRAGKFFRRPLSAFCSPCAMCPVISKCLHDSMSGLTVRPYTRRRT